MSKSVQVSFRIPSELKALIEKAAHRDSRTVSAWVVLQLQKSVAKTTTGKGVK